MNFSPHILFVIVFCFGVIRSETDGKANLTLSKSGILPPKNVESPKNESEPRTSKKDQCLQKLYFALRQNSCRSSKEVLEKLRCDLLDEIGNDICVERIIPSLGSDIEPTPLNCKRNYRWKNTSGPTVFLLLAGWNSTCENICNREQFKRVCEILLSYYVDPKASDEPKLPSNNNDAGVKPEKINDEGNGEPQDPDIAIEGQNPDPNPDLVPLPSSEDEQRTRKEQDQKEVKDNSIKETDDPKKSDSSKDEQALDSAKSVNIEDSRGDASVASPEKIFASTSVDREGDSHSILFYFLLVSGMCTAFYFMMYKKKILALMIEGRRRNVKRRPNSAAYSKLDCNLEEAMSSGPSTSSSNTLMY